MNSFGSTVLLNAFTSVSYCNMAIAHANTLAATSMTQVDESKVSGEIVSLLRENFFPHTYAGSMKGKPPSSY